LAATADGWDSYVAFSAFDHIAELVTLDYMLCCSIVEEVLDDDWNLNVQADIRLGLFRDPEYPLTRHPIDRERRQLIAALENPGPTDAVPNGFMFCGYDVMDSEVGISTLTNCGPIPEAFKPPDVNCFGLVDKVCDARRIRDRMRELQPEDSHLGDCEVWAIARRILDSE
jgi:hypothetical protein